MDNKETPTVASVVRSIFGQLAKLDNETDQIRALKSVAAAYGAEVTTDEG